MNRRKVSKILLTLAGGGLVTGSYAHLIEPHWLEVVRLNMPIKNLPKNLQGKTLLQISDIHAGPRVNFEYLRKSLLKAQSLQTDFVMYTGDYIHIVGDSQLKHFYRLIEYFPKGKLHTLAILGNHDYGLDWLEPKIATQIQNAFQDRGIEVLRNQATTVSGLTVMGIDDYWGTNFRPTEIEREMASTKISLVLCHNPDVLDEPVWRDYKGWVLSGHTHGGQVKPPFLNPPVLPVKNKRFSSGLIHMEDGRQLYINRALGFLHKIRFNVRPEITLFTLKRG